MSAKRALLNGAYKALYPLGAPFADGGITILCYHSLDDFATGISVPPRLFATQMATLAATGCKTFTMSQVATRLAAGRPFPRRAVALTFDDGFANVGELAAPVMARYGFNATIYAISSMAGRVTAWTDHDRPLPALRILDWPDLKALQRAGHEIGAHTVSHGFLSEYSPADLRREVEESRIVLEGELGTPVVSFAYPQGDYNAAVVAAVQAAGYTSAVTLDQGRAGRRADPLRLPRLYVGNNTGPDALRAFLVPSVRPAYWLINFMIRGVMGRKTWPGPLPGTVQSSVTRPVEVATR